MPINVNDYTYKLPPAQIAAYPLDRRDQSKLLVYEQGNISHRNFESVAAYLPSGSLLVFNNTKVIPARLHFKKETGADIEIFLLNPISPSAMVLEAMQAKGMCVWKCIVGNLKRWNEGIALVKQVSGTNLTATLEHRQEGHVRFSWDTAQSFAELVEIMGETPLPPYLNRKPESVDRVRYQTIYSRYEGAVAAPTAGLHFTPEVFESLHAKAILADYVTLHVSAGTFQPIKTADAVNHTMHSEQIMVSRLNIEHLMAHPFVAAVGTTSLRTIESLYWFGAKLQRDPDARFDIHQNDPYVFPDPPPSRVDALAAVISYMDRNHLDILAGETTIYILPGYTFRMCDGLITNFHQPGSTLILLIAAFIGEDWRTVYAEALANNYRFLSYGDSSLLLPRR